MLDRTRLERLPADLALSLRHNTGLVTAAALFLALYLGTGWMILGFVRPLAGSLPSGAFICLALGGIVYSLGAVVHRLSRLRFHNAAWHALVTVAAGLQFAAVAQVVMTA